MDGIRDSVHFKHIIIAIITIVHRGQNLEEPDQDYIDGVF